MTVCCSTKSDKYPLRKFENSQLFRFGLISGSSIKRYFTFFQFNILSTLLLFLIRPKSVLYYETVSAFPALIYKKLRGKSVVVACHYHEYVSKEEYLRNSFINKKLHSFEQSMYSKINWISHTNGTRRELFCKDENINIEKVNVLPNYPSKNWAILNKLKRTSEPLKLVFVGYSVDPESCYIIELINWLSNQNQHTSLDLYCLMPDSLPKQYVGQIRNTTVAMKSAVEYNDLPGTLKEYHVGVILYKGLIPNYIYNAPNKLFEYLSCGLDVWYPKEMKGIKEYQSNCTPKVKEFDFIGIGEKILDNSMFSNEEDIHQGTSYYAEDVYENLITFFKKY